MPVRASGFKSPFGHMNIEQALLLIREIPDYPKPGIRFQDITPLIGDGRAFSAVTKYFSSLTSDETLIAGIEARGFIFAAAVANEKSAGFAPIRKAGKLPFTTISQSYGLEYGVDTLEIHIDAVTKGAKVFLIDDVLATGGTICAAIELIIRSGGAVTHVATLLEIDGLGGRSVISKRYPKIALTSLKTT